jgi:hypothetical protein
MQLLFTEGNLSTFAIVGKKIGRFNTNWQQGCQIFLETIYQTEKIYQITTKLP